MTTKTEYITQAKAENPKPMFATINGEQIELTDAEYEETIEALATMQLEQETVQIDTNTKVEAKASALDKLGLTADEAAALFG